MAVQELTLAAEKKRHRGKGHFALAMRRLLRKRIAIICIIVLIVVYCAGIFAPWVTPYKYTDQDHAAFRDAPTMKHLAGTDLAGRDVFTRVLFGIQNTVILTTVGMLSGGLLIGITLGLISGYFGRKIDTVIMRIGEVFASFPDILLIIIIAATIRPRILDWVHWVEDHSFLDGLARIGIVDYVVISVALVSFGWIGMARLVRGQILFLKEMPYVEAARASGASTPQILFRHLLPNAISPIIVTVSMGMGAMVGAELVISWLGLGIQPPRPSLGVMLSEGGSVNVLTQYPWLLLAPSAVAFTLTLAWNLLGDALNDVLNPRTR